MGQPQEPQERDRSEHESGTGSDGQGAENLPAALERAAVRRRRTRPRCSGGEEQVSRCHDRTGTTERYTSAIPEPYTYIPEG